MTQPTIAIYQVSQILQGLQRQGLDAAPLLRRAGIAPALLHAPLARVTQQQYAALLRLLARRMNDEFVGLLGQPVPLGSLAQAGRLLVHCRTLGDALRLGLRHYRALLHDFAPRLQVQRGVAQVRLQTRVPRDAAAAYAERMFLFLGYGLACWLVARRIPLQEVQYADPPASVARSEVPRLFETVVRDGAAQAGWCFDAAWLELPVVQTAPSWAEFLRQAPANLLVRYRDQSTVTERIRRLLRRHLAAEMPTLDVLGAQLSMTPQTLRRRLRDEGQGFQALKDDLRRDAAIACLARPDLSLADIARQLGFLEASTFHRAFKQWTGVAPGEYRLRQRCAGGDAAAAGPRPDRIRQSR